MDIKITFPGGKKVDAEVTGMVIHTDQPKLEGGEDTAPGPYLLFLASIGTCAGIYVLSFCQERNIPTDKITLTERLVFAQRLKENRSLTRSPSTSMSRRTFRKSITRPSLRSWTSAT